MKLQYVLKIKKNKGCEVAEVTGVAQCRNSRMPQKLRGYNTFVQFFMSTYSKLRSCEVTGFQSAQFIHVS